MKIIISLVIAFSVICYSEAQIKIGQKINDKVNQRADDKVDKAIDDGIGKAEVGTKKKAQTIILIDIFYQ